MSETTEIIEISRAPIDLLPVESSQIHSIGHNPEAKTMAIQFKDRNGGPGNLYHYGNVGDEDFAAFKNADSLGRHFGLHIKPHKTKYPYVQIKKDDAQS